MARTRRQRSRYERWRRYGRRSSPADLLRDQPTSCLRQLARCNRQPEARPKRYSGESGRIEVFAGRGKAFAEVRIYNGSCSNKIYWAVKQSLQAFLEGKVGVRVGCRRDRLELDNKIQIARR